MRRRIESESRPGRIGLSRKVLYFVAQCVALAALILLFFWAFGAQFTRGTFPRSLAMTFIYCLTIGGSMWLVMPKAGPAIARLRRPAVQFLALTGLVLMVTFAGCLVAGLIFVVLEVHPAGYFWIVLYHGFRVGAIVALGIGGSVTVYEWMRTKLDATTLELKTRELEKERALKLATEAQLASLASRIQPHFLFNTLNSISALIQEDPVRAERMVEKLAALVRFSLDASQHGTVPLGQEIRIVRDYLDIEQTRFGDRLRYSLDVPEALLSHCVPPLSLQTLAENSVKYAVAPRREGAVIAVRVSGNGGGIRLEVWDDGPGFTLERFLPGHGLDNLRQRLRNLHPEADLTVEPSEGGTAVAFTIPGGAHEQP